MSGGSGSDDLFEGAPGWWDFRETSSRVHIFTGATAVLLNHRLDDELNEVCDWLLVGLGPDRPHYVLTTALLRIYEAPRIRIATPTGSRTRSKSRSRSR